MKRWSVVAVAIALGGALSWPPARARAEGSTLSSVKIGACALLTAADARRLWNVPMQVELGAPGQDPPGRTCAYRPVQPDAGRRTVQLRLLEPREWDELKAGVLGKREIAGLNGIGDEAYLVRVKPAARASAWVLFARKGRSQFSVRVAGTGVQPTAPLKQVARSVAARL